MPPSRRPARSERSRMGHEDELSPVAIVDLMLVNGTAFRQLRVACETHTGVYRVAIRTRLAPRVANRI
eukprot:scaffold3473_cov122-Isochrysis_galbana.AAC.13